MRWAMAAEVKRVGNGVTIPISLDVQVHDQRAVLRDPTAKRRDVVPVRVEVRAEARLKIASARSNDFERVTGLSEPDPIPTTEYLAAGGLSHAVDSIAITSAHQIRTTPAGLSGSP